MRALPVLILCALIACKNKDASDSDPVEADTDTDTDADADTDTDTDADTDADADADSGDSGDSGGDSGGVVNPPPPCSEDLLEENDTRLTATPGITNETGLWSVDPDSDWFVVEVPANGIATVEIQFIDAWGDIDLAMYDANNTYITGSGGVSNSESMSVVNGGNAPVTYWAEVYMWTNGACNEYDLQITSTVLPPEDCANGSDDDQDGAVDCADYGCVGDPACANCPPEDAFEDNDTQATAVAATVAADLMVHAQDADWYSIEVADGELASFTIDHVPTAGEVDITLLDANGAQLDIAATGPGLRTVGAVNDSGADATWYLRVVSQGTCNSYSLTPYTGPIPPEDCDDGADNDLDDLADCEDYECVGDAACAGICPAEDAFEDNDTAATATFGLTSLTDLAVHLQDPDWFTFEVAAGDIGQVTVTTPGTADVDIRMFNEAGALVDSALTADDIEVVFVQNTTAAAQIYDVEVHVWTGSVDVCSSYDLDIYSGPIPDEACGDGFDNDLDTHVDCDDYDCLVDAACANTCPAEDPFEDNDTAATAVPAVSLPGLMVHKQDPDFFTVEVAPGEIADITATLVNAEGDIDLNLRDAQGALVDSALTAANVENVFVVNTGTAPETYTLEVFVWTGSTSDCNDYELDVFVGPVPDEACDDGDDNDLDLAEDCDDYDCLTDPACAGECPPEDALGGVNGTFESALELSGLQGMMVHAQAPDWYLITVGPNEVADIEVSFVDADGNIGLDIYDATGVRVNGVNTTTDDETFRLLNQTAASQTWAARVSVAAADVCNSYDWAVTVAPVPPETCGNGADEDLDGYEDCEDYTCAISDPTCGCPADDAFEPNDTPAEALPGVLTATDLSVYRERADFFVYTVPAGSALSALVAFTDADGDIDIRATRLDTDAQVFGGATTTNNESGTFTNTSADPVDVLLEVFVWEDTAGNELCNTYDLTVTITP